MKQQTEQETKQKWVCVQDIQDISAWWCPATGETYYQGSWEGIESMYTSHEPTMEEVDAWGFARWSSEFCDAGYAYRSMLEFDGLNHSWKEPRAARLHEIVELSATGQLEQAAELMKELKPSGWELQRIHQMIPTLQTYLEERKQYDQHPALKDLTTFMIQCWIKTVTKWDKNGRVEIVQEQHQAIVNAILDCIKPTNTAPARAEMPGAEELENPYNTYFFDGQGRFFQVVKRTKKTVTLQPVASRSTGSKTGNWSLNSHQVEPVPGQAVEMLIECERSSKPFTRQLIENGDQPLVKIDRAFGVMAYIYRPGCVAVSTASLG